MPDVRYKVTSGRLNRQSKFRAVVAFLLVLICIALGGYIYCLRVIQRDSCLTKECIEATANFLSSINTEVKPCENIYQHVCGNGRYNIFNNNQVSNQMRNLLEKPPSYKDWAPLELQKQFYQTCTDFEIIDRNEEDRMSSIVEVFGGWPVVKGSSWKNFSIEEAYEKSWMLGLPVDFFFQLNTANESETMEITYPKQIEHFDDSFIENVYLTLMVETAVFFGGSRLIAEKDLLYVLEFEKMLDKIIKNTDTPENYDIINIEEFVNVLTQINMSKVLDISSLSNMNKTLIKVNMPFLEELNLILAGVSSRTKANYYIWKTIQYFGPYLNAPLRSNFLNFYRMTDNAYYTYTDSRYDFCLRDSRLRFPHVIEISLTKSQSFKDKIQCIEDMLKNIKYSFKSRVANSKWIDEQTRDLMKVKIDSVSNFFGYNEITEGEVFSYYSNIENFNLSSGNIIDMILDINIFHRQQEHELNIIGPDLSCTSYIETSNSIFIAASILERLQEKRPNYLNYGALAPELAHHIAHSLQLDVINWEDGNNVLSEDNENILWKNETFHKFFARVTCVMEQFPNETDNDLLIEDVIDTIAIDVAYESYLEWVIQNGEEAKLPGLTYTPNQLFWLQYIWNYCNVGEFDYKGKEHTVRHFGNRMKLLNTLSNSLYFSSDFNCSNDSVINNHRKCYIF